MLRRKTGWLAAGIALLALLAGCASSRLTRANYDRVAVGMTEREVVEILGDPDENKGGGIAIGDIDASGRVMTWESGDRHAVVTFAQGKVVAKVQHGL